MEQYNHTLQEQTHTIYMKNMKKERLTISAHHPLIFSNLLSMNVDFA